MGWISVVFAHKVINVATSGELDDEALHHRLFGSVGLDPSASVDPEQMICDSDFFGLLERIADQALRGRDVALRVGASMRCDEYGAFGLAFKSAVDLESSYVRVERYGRIVTSIAIAITCLLYFGTMRPKFDESEADYAELDYNIVDPTTSLAPA